MLIFQMLERRISMSESRVDNKDVIDTLMNIISSMPRENYFKVNQCYNLHVNSSWHIDNRIKRDLFIVYIRSGSGKYIIDGHEILMSKGKIVFIGNDVKHSIRVDKIDTPSFISIHFGIFNNLSKKLVNMINRQMSFEFVPSDNTKYRQIFEDIYNYMHLDMPSSHNTLMINSLMSQLFCLISHESRYVNTKNRISDPRIEHAKTYLENNPLGNIKIKALSNKYGLSRKYFSKIFKELYHMSPKEYQIRLKIDYAIFLLKEKDLSVKQASIELNYPDPYTFSKQFKNITGVSPKEFKYQR